MFGRIILSQDAGGLHHMGKTSIIASQRVYFGRGSLLVSRKKTIVRQTIFSHTCNNDVVLTPSKNDFPVRGLYFTSEEHVSFFGKGFKSRLYRTPFLLKSGLPKADLPPHLFLSEPATHIAINSYPLELYNRNATEFTLQNYTIT